MARRKGWRQHVVVEHSPRVVHVTPIADLQKHEHHACRPWARCWCQPKLGRGRIEGRRFYLVVHNAADARESVERYGLM